jgi:hypothetical protein
MDIQKFKNSVGGTEPPGNLPPPLRALWHQAKGDWDKAHSLVQAENTQAAAWVALPATVFAQVRFRRNGVISRASCSRRRPNRRLRWTIE